MVRGKRDQHQHHHLRGSRGGGLVVGNYCHDVLFRDGDVVAETLGGAASFVSTVLDALSLPYTLVSKVGQDFAYSAAAPASQPPLVSAAAPTTLFHARFHAAVDADRVLSRIATCDPILAADLPGRGAGFEYGMAVGVGGEILPETLERMIESCSAVFVDIQALIRAFDGDGKVRLVRLKESGFFHLLPRIGFLKASGEEAAAAVDLEEVRKLCCVVVTNGDRGCSVYWNDGEAHAAPFPTVQVDPTGAGDCFLGAFAAGIVQGLPVPDAALLGNLFGSLAVGQIGVPNFDPRLCQRVKDEIQRRKVQCTERKDEKSKFTKLAGLEQFYGSLVAAKSNPVCAIAECKWDLAVSPEVKIDQFNVHPKLLTTSVSEESIQRVD